MKTFFTSIFLCSISFVFSQEAIFKGNLTTEGKSAPNVNVILQSGKTKTGVVSSSSGSYEVKIPAGTYKVTISALGLQTISEEITFTAGQIFTKNYQLKEDFLGLDQVVVTGTQKAFPYFLTPVVVSKISGKVFETTQSLSLSEGLKFTPGLRTETNCQNCGFNQLRINGLEGAYSQILINGRPVFSALAGVYGLEMIPSNMIQQIEVIRGSGSALYGGNAIGGTVNILTKDPIENSFSVGNNLSLYEGKTPDNTLIVNASVVSDSFDKGLTLFAYNRSRNPYDANGDDFSEITKLKNTTFGADMFWNTSERSKIKLNLNTINEFRRGGNQFDLQPHESEVTEQLEHRIFGGDASFEHFSLDYKHKFSYYFSGQHTARKSYYGGGIGKSISSEDEFNALSSEDKETFFGALGHYGKADGFIGIGGVQYTYVISDRWNLWLGTEYKSDRVSDNAGGKDIKQNVKTFGNYAQLEWKPSHDFTLLAGGRYDYIDIKGDYIFGNSTQKSNLNLSKFVPRFTAMYELADRWKLRATYAQGYRAPQAFDEDLHTGVLDGDPFFVKLAKDLKPELSNSFTGSINYTQKEGNTQANIILEGFFTRIKNGFYNETISEGGKISHQLKQNSADNLDVMGINAEMNFAFSDKVIWQTGLTLQNSKYSKVRNLWEDENNPDKKLESDKVLKTPNLYGYTTLTYSPTSKVSLSYSGVFTGKMYVKHIVNQEHFLKETPVFYEQNLRGAYTFSLDKNYKLELSAGVQNLFNSYQKDFDKGKNRDADYIYGPQKPRTYFMGITFKMN